MTAICRASVAVLLLVAACGDDHEQDPFVAADARPKDAGVPDAFVPPIDAVPGTPDGALPDADLSPDAGVPDAAVPDAIPPDAAPPDADVCPPFTPPGGGAACECGDGVCNPGETVGGCADCDSCCDGVCGPGEDSTSCPGDCDTCGDGVCQAHENTLTCGADCEGCVGATTLPPSDGTTLEFGVVRDTTAGEINNFYGGCHGADTAPDKVYTFIVPSRLAALTVSLEGSAFDTALHVYREDCNATERIVCNDDAFGKQSGTTLFGVEPGRINVVVDGFGSASGDFVLTVRGLYDEGSSCDPARGYMRCTGGCRDVCYDSVEMTCGTEVCDTGGTSVSTFSCGEMLDCADGIDLDGDGSTDEDTCSSPPTVTCPTDVVDHLVFTELSLDPMTVTDGGIITRVEWRLIDGPSQSSATLDSTEARQTTFTPDYPGMYTLQFTATDNEDQTTACEVLVGAKALDCFDEAPDAIDSDFDTLIDEDGGACVDPPVVACPTDFSVPVFTDATVAAGVTDGGSILSTDWVQIAKPSTSFAVPIPPDAPVTQLTPDVSTAGSTSVYRLQFSAIDDEGHMSSCRVDVTADGFDCVDGVGSIDADNDGLFDEDDGTGNCPTPPVPSCLPTPPFTVPVNSPYAFMTMVTALNPIALDVWRTSESPEGSTALPIATGFDTWQVTPILAATAAAATKYTFRYVVIDNLDQIGACEFDLEATTTEELRVELLWNTKTPEGLDSSDLDLHILHPLAQAWFDPANDCYFSTCSGAPLSWGPGGAEDDPDLVRDDTDGRGPEIITIETPEDGVYSIGVHYFDPGGFGDVEAQVNIWCGGTLFEIPMSPATQSLSAHGAGNIMNDFWKVADVTISGGSCSAVPLELDEVVPAALARSVR